MNINLAGFTGPYGHNHKGKTAGKEFRDAFLPRSHGAVG
jgi:hypothetical protein